MVQVDLLIPLCSHSVHNIPHPDLRRFLSSSIAHGDFVKILATYRYRSPTRRLLLLPRQILDSESTLHRNRH
jgi:hypothetical protein